MIQSVTVDTASLRRVHWRLLRFTHSLALQLLFAAWIAAGEYIYTRVRQLRSFILLHGLLTIHTLPVIGLQ